MNTLDHALSWDKLGVYTPHQAARLLRTRPDSLARWVYGDRDAAVFPQYPDHQGEFLTFIDLVQAMRVRQLRQARTLSLQKIRKTVKAAAELGIQYPFARRHTAYVFADEVVLRMDDDQLIYATGKYRHQQLFEPIVDPYFDDLGFDANGYANRYTPARDKFRAVVLDPMVNFGAPSVLPGRLTVDTLVNSLEAEGSLEAAADVCNVPIQEVELAAEYESRLRNAA